MASLTTNTYKAVVDFPPYIVKDDVVSVSETAYDREYSYHVLRNGHVEFKISPDTLFKIFAPVHLPPETDHTALRRWLEGHL